MIHMRSRIFLNYVLLNSKSMTNSFDDFVNVIRKDPKVRNKK